MRIDRQGTALVATAVAASFVIAVPQWISLGVRTTDTIYDPSRTAVVGLLLVAAIIAALGSDRARGSAYGAGFVMSAQLAGSGVVAFRHWRPYFGQSGGDPQHVALLQALAVVLAISGLIGAGICVNGVRSGKATGRGQPSWLRASLMSIAVLALVAMPWLFGHGSSETVDRNSLLGYAALASVPIAASFAVAGWVDLTTARVVLLTVCASAIVDWRARDPMTFQFHHPDLPFALIAGTALVSAITTVFVSTPRAPGALD